MKSKSFKFEIDKDGIATLVWNMPDSKLNLIDLDAIEYIGKIADEVASNDAVKGVILRSGKESFSGGAKLTMFYPELRKRLAGTNEAENERANRILLNDSRQLSLNLRKIETCGKPWVALINGTCVGGGIEFALACHARIATEDESVKISLPEIRIGLIPGGGGTQRVIRMCDPQEALAFMLRGTTISSKKAKSMNLVDKLVPPDEMIASAKKMLQEGVDPVKPWDKKGFKLPGGKVYSPAGFQFWMAANAHYKRETHDNYSAARRLIQTVHDGMQLPMDLALEIESRNFVKVLRTKEAENMIRTLFISMNELNRGALRPANQEPAKIQKVGIIGAGFMGAGIAYVTAHAGIGVVLLDRDLDTAEKGKASCEAIVDKAVKRGKVRPEQRDELLNRIVPTAAYDDIKDCDLVIEAVFEDISIKNKVLEAVDKSLGSKSILASNTSTLPITSLAKATKQPEKFIGIHFFSPVEKMRLVEIILGEKTDERTLATVFDYVSAIRKTPIVVNDGLGFYTSRVVMSYINEGVMLLHDGVPAPMVENIGKMAGMPVGPLALADEVALDLAWKIVCAKKSHLGDKYVNNPVDDILEKLVVKCERFGRKNKKGFYEYPEKGEKFLWPDLAEVTGGSKPAESFDKNEIKHRLLSIMALETARIYDEKIIKDVREADVGSILGFGFAPYTGGTLSFIDSLGIPQFVAMCENLEKKFGDRFKPNKMLSNMAKGNESFYPKILDPNSDMI